MTFEDDVKHMRERGLTIDISTFKIYYPPEEPPLNDDKIKECIKNFKERYVSNEKNA